jgi:hypothetical protein
MIIARERHYTVMKYNNDTLRMSVLSGWDGHTYPHASRHAPPCLVPRDGTDTLGPMLRALTPRASCQRIGWTCLPSRLVSHGSMPHASCQRTGWTRLVWHQRIGRTRLPPCLTLRALCLSPVPRSIWLSIVGDLELRAYVELCVNKPPLWCNK